MRNLKKVLALVLALVMSLSLVTIANASDFSDDADINYDEAVDVMVAAGIIDGVGNNSFDPNGTLTREQAAKLITYMLMGENSDKLGVESSRFKDVAVTRWSAPAIEYCATMGIIDGAGDGNFYPAGKLTGYAFAKMLLTALGYKSDREGYTGNNWTINVATKALSEDVKLNAGLETMFGSAELTRQEAAQMALNAIKAPLVEYDNDNTISVNGATVQINGSGAKFVTTTIGKEQRISDRRLTNTATNTNNSGYTVEFGERYLPKLECKRDVDAFGRPSYTWTYDKKDIGTYINTELLDQTYTDEVTGKNVYDLLGSGIMDDKDYTFRITIDGVEVDKKTGTTDNNTVLKKTAADKPNSYFDETYFAKSYKSAIGQTGKGVLTQVFVNSETKHVDVAVINTYLAKATNDYSAKKDEVTFKVYAMNSEGSGANEVFFKYVDACKTPGETNQTKNIKVSGEDFDVADVKKDDIFLVTVANGVIKTIAEPEVLSAVSLSAFSKNKYVISGGTQYDYNTTVEYDPDTLDLYTSVGSTQQLKNTQYNVYLDPYGYMIGIEVVEAVKNYIFLTGIDRGTSNLKNKTAEAAGILMDGTFVEFKLNLDDSVAYYDQGGSTYASAGKEFQAGPLWNTWCTYTVDKNGVYTLTEVKQDGDKGSKDKAGQYHDASAFDPAVTTPAANSIGKKINSKNVSLKKTNVPSYVYGNDKTIYIVPELNKVASDSAIDASKIPMPTDGTNSSNQAVAAQDPVGIISDVSSIATGIDNVDLITWNANQIDDEIDLDSPIANASFLKAYSGGTYTLYDNDGYIIAAVVVGEDNGASKSLVYSHKDDISKEEYSDANDEWTWERKVISDGEEITLTEKGSKLAKSGLKAMAENVWYEITYKADGTVKEANPAYYIDSGKNIGKTGTGKLTLTNKASSIAGDFVKNIDELEYAINNNNKTVTLYEEVWGNGTDAGCTEDSNATDSTGKPNMTKAPSLVESTLYVDTATSKGFYVSKDVKTVLIQKNDGKKDTTYYSGISDLEGVLDDLNYDGTTYLFKISAILTNGRATLVVIHDWNETGAQTSGDHGTATTISGVDATYKANGDVEIVLDATNDISVPSGTTVKIELMKLVAADADGNKVGSAVVVATSGMTVTGPATITATTASPKVIAGSDWSRVTGDYFVRVTVTTGSDKDVYVSDTFFIAP